MLAGRSLGDLHGTPWNGILSAVKGIPDRLLDSVSWMNGRWATSRAQMTKERMKGKAKNCVTVALCITYLSK